MKKIMCSAVAALFLIVAGKISVEAAPTITLTPSTYNANLNDVFTLDIMGQGFDGITCLGGGLDLNFNSSVLNINQVYINPAAWNIFNLVQNIDNNTGYVTGMFFNSMTGFTDSFNIATITFSAVGSGTSDLDLIINNLNPFVDTKGPIAVNLINTSAVVSTVPEPISISLLLCGGFGLMGFSKWGKK